MRASRSRPIAVMLAACATALAAPAALAQATAPADALRLLNLQRAANGIPGDIARSAALDDGCAKHVAYIGLNGRIALSGEDPAKPGYTPEGDRQTLESSGVELLSGVTTWSEQSSPWLLAPAHLYRLLDPEVAVAGYADGESIACLRVRGDRAPATAPELYSVPGPGRAGVAPSEAGSEAPYAPQQLAGIPAGQATGPNILLFTRGLRGAQPLSAAAYSLTGPQGPVAAQLVTETTTSPIGSGAWFRGGGVLIPAAPLAPFSAYVARVTWHRDAEDALPAAEAEQIVPFETDGLANPITIDVVSRGDVNEIRVRTPSPNATLKLTGPGRLVDIARVSGGVARYAGLEPGQWTACAHSGGRAFGYAQQSVCEQFTAAAKVPLALATLRGRTTVALRVPRVADGRPAQLTVARYRLECREQDGRRRCTRKAIGRAKRSSIVLRAPRMTLELPRPRPGVKVSARVTLAQFEVGDAPYLASNVKRTWE